MGNAVSAEQGARPGVIVADDDADVRTLVAIAVARSGLELIEELDEGESAWEAIQTFAPELVVLDVSMPGKTGLELTRLIRADPQLEDTHVILLSAAVDEEAQRAGLEAGADEYMLKPFSPRELADRLAGLAEHLLLPSQSL
jgi:DNA-binding response OmpR family regulator